MWAALSDTSRMPLWSPELMSMTALKPGGLRPGQWYVGLNRRGFAVWPTRNVITEVVAGSRLSWLTTSSGATWIYQLDPTPEGHTEVTLRRPVDNGLPLVARAFAGVMLGGAVTHAVALQDDMRTTLERLKDYVEQL